MRHKDIIVIGASAGAVDVLKTVVAGLPARLEASIFVVVHTAPDAPGLLADILDRTGPLHAAYASQGERIDEGRIYVAPPDQHLIIEPGSVRLTRAPRENRFRPAVDPLFRSAAQIYGPRTVGVILTGGLDDGTNGLWAIKQLGGTAIVQDPDEAMAPSMPLSALRHVRVDYTVKAIELAPLLVQLAATPADAVDGKEDRVPEGMNVEIRIAKEESARGAGVEKLGPPSSYACPECHGVLLELADATPIRFRCHTGHAYTLESLLAEMDEAIGDSLWNAVRALEERAMLLERAARHLREMHEDVRAYAIAKAAEESQRRAQLVQSITQSDDREGKTASLVSAAPSGISLSEAGEP